MNYLRSKCRELLHFEISEQLIYEVSFVMIFVITFFQTSTYTIYFPENLPHQLSFIPILFILFKISFYDSKSARRIILNLLTLGILFILWRTSGEFILFISGIFIIGAQGVNFKRIIYLYLVIGTILLSFIFFTSLMGLTKALVFYREPNIVRQAFGIIYPTDFAAHILFLVLAYCYLNFEKLTWKSYIVFTLLAIFMIKFSDARLNAYALIITIPIIMIGQRAKEGYIVSKNIANFYWTVPAIASYVMVFICYIYAPTNRILEKINSLLSNRLALSHLALEKYGVKLFGQHVHENGFGAARGIKDKSVNMYNYFYIDSSFIRLLIIYGVIALVLVVMIMTIIAWKSVKKRDFALASIMIIVTVSALVEQRLFDLGYDPFLIALLAECYSNNKQIGVRNENIHNE